MRGSELGFQNRGKLSKAAPAKSRLDQAVGGGLFHEWSDGADGHLASAAAWRGVGELHGQTARHVYYSDEVRPGIPPR